MLSFLPRRDDNFEIILPTDAAAEAMSSPGASWAFSSWNQLDASVAPEFVLCGMYLNHMSFIPGGTSIGVGELQVEVGIGGSGSEVVVAAGHTSYWGSNPSPNTVNVLTSRLITLPFNPILIPSGSRISTRSASNGLTSRVACFLYGYDYNSWSPVVKLPIPDLDRYLKGARSPTQGTVVTPSAGTTTITSAAYSTYGSWTTMIASAPRDLLVTGFSGWVNDQNENCQVQIGVKPSGGSIFARSKIAFPDRNVLAIPPGTMVYLPRPLFVKAGEVVQARITAKGIRDYECAILTEELL